MDEKEGIAVRIRGGATRLLTLRGAAWVIHLLVVVGIRSVPDLLAAPHAKWAEFQRHIVDDVLAPKLRN